MKCKIFLISFILTAVSFSQSKGNLVIIGGGERTETIMKKIIDLSGGINSRIIIIPNASSDPVEAGEYQLAEFKDLGCTSVEYLILDSLNVNDTKTNEKFNNTRCIFFSGGDQSRLTHFLLGSKMLKKIREIYDSGGVISGTSAGAAVMSKIMITGDEIINKDSTMAFHTIMKGNIKFTEGFGFVENVIIDQHFIKRKRNNRLLSLVLEHPDNIGIGIDESTAVIVYPDNTFEVLGENSVLIFDATHAENIKVDRNNNLSGSNILMHVLIEGQKFDLSKKILVK